MEPVIIVGSGLAGYTVAREFRKLDKQTELVMITADNGDFYSKPLLSNAFAQKKAAAQLVSSAAEAMAAQLHLTLRPHTKVLGIDAAGHRLETSSGTCTFSKLVLALGAQPIRLPLTGNGADDVLSVNNLADYGRFRDLTERARRIVVIGAGLIGCEFANDLLHAGVQPVVVDPNPYPLATLLPEPAAQAVKDALHTAGVTWRLGTTVVSVDRIAPAGRVRPVDAPHARPGPASEPDLQLGGPRGAPAASYRVTCADGMTLEADAVLSAVGLRPNVDIARAAGLRVGRGIAVDPYAATSMPDVYALGDCAEYEGLVMPYVLPIMTVARGLAATLAGERTPFTFPVMPVSIKTPAHPVAVHPVSQDEPGQWDVAEVESGLKMLFRSPAGELKGFVLTGARVGERAALARMMS